MFLRHNKTYLRATIIVIVLIMLHFLHILSPIESGLTLVLKPFLGGLRNASTNITKKYQDLNQKTNLTNELDRIKVENSLLLRENQRLKYLRQENAKLRSFVSFKASKELSLTLTNVISVQQATSLINTSILLDKGIKDGIIHGLAVIDASGMMVGRITDLTNYTSKICLITEKNCEFAVMIQGSRNTSGISNGELNLISKMNYIPQTQLVNLGDIVVTSGLESNIPAGLILGSIVQIFQESNDVWKSAIIEPKSAVDNIGILAIVMP